MNPLQLIQKVKDSLRHVVQPPTEPRNTKYYGCDGCGKTIEANVDVYHCMSCTNFDFCYDCYQIYGEEHAHDGIRMVLRERGQRKEEETVSLLCLDIFRYFFARPCIGYRTKLPSSENNNNATSSQYGNYIWLTYEEVFLRSLHFALGLKSLGVKMNDNVAVCSINQLEWFLYDFACMWLSCTSVPIHTSFDEDAKRHILEQTASSWVVVSKEELHQFLGLKAPSLKHIVVMDGHEFQKNNESARDSPPTVVDGITVYSFHHVEKLGSSLHRTADIFAEENLNINRDPKRLFTIMYTSGSTGVPKGVPITDAVWHAKTIDSKMPIVDPFIVISFCPLAHSMDRMQVYGTLINGGRVGVYHGDMAELFDDIRTLQPSMLASTPRLWNKLFQDYSQVRAAEIEAFEAENKRPVDEKALIHIDIKLQEQYRTIFGNRLRSVVTGGAPTSPAVKNFLKKVFITVTESYGASEVGGITADDFVIQGVQQKLIDCPEMGYTLNDKPFPRGEIVVKTNYMIDGYYKNETATQEQFTEDGWFRTGDIGEQIASNKIHIIDRKKNLFKLSQGEYVSPERLENIYITSKFISQIYVYGTSMHSYVLAVVIPQHYIVEYADKHNVQESYENLCRNEWMLQVILADITRIGTDAKLSPWEIPRRIICDSQPFTQENGLLTPSLKLARPKLEKRYKEELTKVYQAQEEAEQSKVKNHLENIIGASQPHDSLAAVRIQNIIRKDFHVEVPIQMLLASENPLQEVEQFIKSPTKQPFSSSSVDFEKEAEYELHLPEKLQPFTGSLKECNNIFLTGATGFLGAFLLRELLEADNRSRIFCLIRSSSQELALDRIIQNMKLYGLYWKDSKDSEHQFDSRVVAVPGDLSLARLGIIDSWYETLTTTVDKIIHNGAQVNGILPYSVLKRPNVEGTVEVLKMATTVRVKPILFVSSIGVYGLSSKVVEEDLPLPASSSIPFLSGYSQSKWVAEKILMKAQHDHNLPVIICRPGDMSGSSKTGALNSADFIVKFLCGVLIMGAAPKLGVSSNPTNRDYVMDMTPVDLAAKLIVHLSNRDNSLGHIHHIVNPQGSLPVNRIIEMLLTCGYSSLKVVPYYQWKAILQEHVQQDSGNNTKSQLLALAPFFKSDFPTSPLFGNKETARIMKEELNTDSFPITEHVIAKYIQWLQSHGYLQ